ncbi:MAG: SRPBCC family protein [Aquabacterium sp.]|nr:MAG: SRPBCC family protein [Aquabacterium sp.]
MPRYQIRITQSFARPVDEVFARLADHDNLRSVFKVPVHRIRDGKGDVNGVGSVRRIGMGPLAVEETVTALARNRSIDYRITKGGAPLRNHRGSLRFSSTPGGSTVHWSIDYEVPLPLIGALVRAVLNSRISSGLRGLG